jgi:serine/threonine protein kinase
MGEGQSARPQVMHRPQKSVFLPAPSKTLTLIYPSLRFTFPIPSYIHSISDLLAFANRKRPEEDPPLIGLRSERGAEVLDQLLSHRDQSCSILQEGEVLVTIHQSTEEEGDINESRFKFLKVIGKGGSSTVFSGTMHIARHISSGRLYALKVFNKRYLVKEDKVKNIFTEREVLLNCHNPFLVGLQWAFQSVRNRQNSHVFFVLELCSGGDLFYHLKNFGRLTEEQAKFYFAEVAIALDLLHACGVVYRDLKPENILIDAKGHVKLTDFGSCKMSAGEGTRFGSFCGSPEYMSPEMLQGRGYTWAIDFYSLGALLYEMLTGLPPFYDRNRANMYRKIQKDALVFPKYLSSAAKSMLSGLLDKDPSSRLSSLSAIQAHHWCTHIPWTLIAARAKAPPFVPSLRKANFDPEYTGLPLELSECDTPVSPGTGTFEEKAEESSGNPFRGVEFPETENVEDLTGLSVNLVPISPERFNNLSSISTDSSKPPDCSRTLYASLADKIREMQEIGFENTHPSYMSTEPIPGPDQDSPRFSLAPRSIRGPGFTPVKPSPKCIRSRDKSLRGSFGEASALWSDSEDF